MKVVSRLLRLRRSRHRRALIVLEQRQVGLLIGRMVFHGSGVIWACPPLYIGAVGRV